jgi:transposase-like protein
MWEMSVAVRRYQGVLAVIGGGETVKDTAARFGVCRQTVHAWLGKCWSPGQGVALWQRLQLEVGEGAWLEAIRADDVFEGAPDRDGSRTPGGTDRIGQAEHPVHRRSWQVRSS